jgi:BMFP domain-containing protein YqiC
MKQADATPVGKRDFREEETDVSTEYIWETFDSLFKTVHRQGLRVEELEARIQDLERRLEERNATNTKSPAAAQPFNAVNEMPAERAA